MKTYLYKIGHVYIEVQMPKDMQMPEDMSLFQVDAKENVEPTMCYQVELVKDIVAKEQELLAEKVGGKEAKRETLQVFQTKRGECRRVNFEGDPLPYALTLCEDKVMKVWFREYYKNMLIYETILLSAFSLEKLMIEDNALVLHCAYMNYKDTAVLFSAASGTGKSTQADLWEKYRGTYTVNGDKSLLICEADGWYANGWPICGSSEICHNESYPIRAIVMLKQAKENKVYPVKGFQALRLVMEQITINGWDREFQMKAMDQLENLLAEVPIYCLECDISEDAVACLENVLR